MFNVFVQWIQGVYILVWNASMVDKDKNSPDNDDHYEDNEKT